MGKLDNKVAIVTASTEGIGFAIARKLAQEGAHVIVSSRKTKNVENAVKALKAENLKVSGITCHVGKEGDRRALLEKAENEFGGVDILVSNAAVNPYFGSILATPESSYDKIFDVNVKSTFFLIKETAPLMKKRGGGAIVMVSSYAGYKPSELLGIYSISKTALISLTKALTPELGTMNIRVNCIAPGIIKTKFSSALYKGPDGEKDLANGIPMQRLGVPEDCSGIVALLCSDEGAYINGETIVIAGGIPCNL